MPHWCTTGVLKTRIFLGLSLCLGDSPVNRYIIQWAMLRSNQRPLPCEGRTYLSHVFAGVQKRLQNTPFYARMPRICSPRFARVGVLLV